MSTVTKFLDLEALEEEFEDDDADLMDNDVLEDFLSNEDDVPSSAPAARLPTSNVLAGAKGRLLQQFEEIEKHYDSTASERDLTLPDANILDINTSQAREETGNDEYINHHWADSARIEDDIVALAERATKLTYTLLLYSFNQTGTASSVREHLIALRSPTNARTFDVVDSWLVRITMRTKIYILVDFQPPSRSIHNASSISQFELFLHSHFPSINTASRQRIDDGHEKQAALRCRTPSHTNWTAKWVSIRGGKYDGDIGFAISGDSYYDVLILPRIDASEYIGLNSNGKRLRTRSHSRPSPSLLRCKDLIVKRHIRGPSIISYGEHTFVDAIYAIYDKFPGKRFLGDLQVVKCRRESLCEALHIHPHHRSLFMQSTSPHILQQHIPYPAAWRLLVNELVEFPVSAVIDDDESPDDPEPDLPKTLTGKVIDVYGNTVEIELDPPFMDWPMVEVWSNKVVKVLNLSEFVTVQLSDDKVIGGWIMAKTMRTVDIFLQDSFQDVHISKMMTVYRNACQRVEDSQKLQYVVGLRSGQSPEEHPQMNPATLPSPLPKALHSSAYYTGSAPWFGSNIVITHGLHKGRRANVVDVELSDKDESGLFIRCVLYGETTRGSPSFSVSYTHVVDELTGWPLRVAFPLSMRQIEHGFKGKETYFLREIKTSWQTRIDSRPPPSISPDVQQPADAQDVHWLLLPALLGCDVEVVWTNSKAKRPRPFVVRPMRYGSSVEVRICDKEGRYNKAISIATVSPKHPGRKADKLNRWMCIRGYYKGTFWRGLQFHAANSSGGNSKSIRKDQWTAFQVELVPGDKDRDMNVQDLILDENLVVLLDPMYERLRNEEYGSRRVGIRDKIDNPFLISVDDLN